MALASQLKTGTKFFPLGLVPAKEGVGGCPHVLSSSSSFLPLISSLFPIFEAPGELSPWQLHLMDQLRATSVYVPTQWNMQFEREPPEGAVLFQMNGLLNGAQLASPGPV